MDFEIIRQFNFLKKPKNGFSKSSDTTSNNGSVSEQHSEYQHNSELLKIKKQNVRLKNRVRQLKTKLENTRDNNAKFIGLIAHDLRSPFNAIIGALELLKENKGADEKEKDHYIQHVYESAKNTLNLIDSLQDWAIAQNNEEYFNPVKINLSELFAELIENIEFSAKQKQIKLCDYVDPNLNITADPQMVRAILRNLIDNAIKFTDNGGTVALTGSDRGQVFEITVNDTGKGISEEIQKQLFKNPFNSEQESCNENGASLGLFLCREFVEVHGGTIKVESEPGRGSKFKFTLPYKTNGFAG
ncbi:MAG: HAMP domain-containing sensor histidine kinase [Bacteroidales bacterium]|nr:HAMP domain-containing histidine kinase [Bacteroidales bacterium]MBS3776603.1 HAMP domain-containing histidine kinase [Bacteroidales bacterium]